MKATIIFAHPNPASFNAAILTMIQQTLANAQIETEVRDLYVLNFNPVLPELNLARCFPGRGPLPMPRPSRAI